VRKDSALPPTAPTAASLRPHLLRCGYGADQLAPFEFDDVTVPVVGFAGKPWDSWSACVAAVDMDGDSRTSAARVSMLGAPTVFVCHAEGVDWWAMGPSGPKGEPRSHAWSEIGAVMYQERESLLPSRIYASKLRKPGSPGEQLWFFDAGLMPAVEKKRGETLTRLVEDVINGLRNELGARLNERQAQEDVYRTVFWLLAAKILHDKRVPRFKQISLTDVDEVFDRIGKHHGETGRFPPFGKSGRPAIDAAAERIATCGSLADVSSESLAHVYDNALIDKTAGSGKRKKASSHYDIRKELGIHATPSVLTHHMLAQLWPLIEDIKVDDRHVFEPACGHTPFLTASMRWLRDWGGADASGDSHQYLRSHLHGLEADPFALELAKLALTLADESHDNSWASALMQGDMFEPNVLAIHAKKTRILLANPPYERFSDAQRRGYGRRGAEITSQTKAVEMLKRTLPALAPGSVFGVVVPQGVLHDKESHPVRQFLLNECELTEIDLFADNLFEHSDHEAAVLMGRRRNGKGVSGTLRYRRVRERGMSAFHERVAFSSDRTVAAERFAATGGASLLLPDLPEVWDYLVDVPRLTGAAEIQKGFEFVDEAKLKTQEVLSKSRRPGWVRAVLRAADDYNIWTLPKHVWIDPTPKNFRRRGAATILNVPQVVLNYAPVAREPWRLKAAIDEGGIAISSRFLAFRPKLGGLSLRVLWAILNSPVANAYAYCVSGKRETLVKEWRAFPLPTVSSEAARCIEGAAAAYLKAVEVDQLAFMQPKPKGAVERVLLALDAEVLKLYDLPPRLERQLLDLFTGIERKGVGCDFRGYYPPGFDAYVPLHELISEEYARSTLGHFRAKHRPAESPDVLRALRTTSGSVQELEGRRRRYAHLSTLLDEWAAEQDDFDARVGPLIEQALRDSAPRHLPED
jgi:hypothetical protein